MPTKLPFLSDDHHFAIANVGVRAGQMEYHLEHLIQAALRQKPNTAKFLLRNLSTDRILALLEALLLDASAPDTATIKSLVSEIGRLRTERNEILHWIWGKTLEEGVALHLSYRPFREPQQKTKTAPEIQQIADDMLKVCSALIWWGEDFQQQFLLALRGKPESPAQPPNSPESGP